MSLRKRMPTAIVLLVLTFIWIQFMPSLLFFLCLQILILVSLLEFYNLFQRKKLFPQRVFGIILALILGFSFYFEGLSLELVFSVCLLLSALYFIVSINKVEKLVSFSSSIALTFFGALYLSFTLNHTFLIREEEGPFYIYFLLVVIFFGDTGAYLLGKLWGRRKLVPIASPRKTWEGSIGGIVFACLGALVVQQFLLKDIILWKAILCGILVHAVAQVSDALESLFKRAVGVKDSSNMLPGHGGFLDRIDSLILATPFFYYFIHFFWK